MRLETDFRTRSQRSRGLGCSACSLDRVITEAFQRMQPMDKAANDMASKERPLLQGKRVYCVRRKKAISPTDSPAGEILNSEKWWAPIHATVRHSLKQKSSSGIFGSVKNHCNGLLNTTDGASEKLGYTLLTEAIEARGTRSVSSPRFIGAAVWELK
jgi:hypothetical protein